MFLVATVGGCGALLQAFQQSRALLRRHFLAILAEVVCAAAVAVGLFTRIAAIPCALTMFVAAFMHHSGGSWGPERELALVYMVGFISIALIGSGAFSADSFRKNK